MRASRDPGRRGTRGGRRLRRSRRTGTPSGSVRGRAQVARRKAPNDGERSPAEAVLEPGGDGLRGFAAVARAGRNRSNEHGVQSIECTRPLQLGQHSVQTVGLLAHVFPEEDGPARVDGLGRAGTATARGTGSRPRAGPRRVPAARTSAAANACGAGTAPASTSSQSSSRRRRPSPPPASARRRTTSPRMRPEKREERRQIRAAQVNRAGGRAISAGREAVEDAGGAVAAAGEEDRVDRRGRRGARGSLARARSSEPARKPCAGERVRGEHGRGSRGARGLATPRREPVLVDRARRSRRRRSSRRGRRRGGRTSVTAEPGKRAPSGPISRILYPARRPRPRSFLWARGRPRARAADPEAAHVK